MSNIAEQKALEAYPVKELKDNFGTRDINRCMREACIQGYDQAIQDFLEKAEKWIEKHIEMFSWVHCDSDGNEEWRNDFKNYMQDESEN